MLLLTVDERSVDAELGSCIDCVCKLFCLLSDVLYAERNFDAHLQMPMNIREDGWDKVLGMLKVLECQNICIRTCVGMIVKAK